MLGLLRYLLVIEFIKYERKSPSTCNIHLFYSARSISTYNDTETRILHTPLTAFLHLGSYMAKANAAPVLQMTRGRVHSFGCSFR
jgi:hypothetical protein